MKKLANRKGMSLAETLVTVIIFSVVLLAVTAGSAASYRVYKQVREKADAETLLSTAVLAVCEDLYNASDVVTEASTAVIPSDGGFSPVKYFYNAALGYNETFTNESALKTQTKETSKNSGKTVITKNYYSGTPADPGNADSTDPAVADKTQALDLYAVIDEKDFQYDAGRHCFRFTVTVYRVGDAGNGKPVTKQTAYAHALTV
jgi:prepilin-type N-terminal cleavage/methylation domain-containing protein